jgi:hypothetical protein
VWSAEAVLVCALALLGRSEQSFPAVEFVEHVPVGVSSSAEGYALYTEARIVPQSHASEAGGERRREAASGRPRAAAPGDPESGRSVIARGHGSAPRQSVIAHIASRIMRAWDIYARSSQTRATFDEHSPSSISFVWEGHPASKRQYVIIISGQR